MNLLNDLCSRIVSPPKLSYSIYDLGSLLLPFGRRTDFQCISKRGFKLRCSIYVPTSDIRTCPKPANINPNCVIYLHSMSGSRLQSVGYVETILRMGYCFCNFDFAGCGNSEGKAISFGSNEKFDTQAVIEHLQTNFGIRNIILWGRSMGAACAVKYNQMITSPNWRFSSTSKIQVKGLLLDSPFKNFSTIAIQIGEKSSQLPRFMVQAAFHILKGKIESLGDFQLQDLDLEKSVRQADPPVIFLTSKTDSTINSKHSQDLFDLYLGRDKQLFFINGLHNDTRDQEYLSAVRKFISRTMQIKTIKVQAKYQKLANMIASSNGVDVEGNKNEAYCQCRLFEPNSTERIIWESKQLQENYSRHSSPGNSQRTLAK